MEDTYSKAYTEILEIIKYLPKDEFIKIPKEQIAFFEENKDNDYKFSFDPYEPIEEQIVSEKTNTLIIELFRDYFATEEQKRKLKTILENNERIYQEELKEKYSTEDIFTKEENNILKDNNYPAIIKKDSFFKKLIKNLKKVFNIKDGQ